MTCTTCMVIVLPWLIPLGLVAIGFIIGYIIGYRRGRDRELQRREREREEAI